MSSSRSAPSPRTVTICVPTLNEASGLEPLLVACRPFADELLVVDGHSRDGSREIAERLGARVLLDDGKGKGAALRLAIAEASCDLIAFIDADGSHDPAELPRLLQPLKDGAADIVVGSRIRGGSDDLSGTVDAFARAIGSHIITLAINLRFGVNITDSQNGFRAMTLDCARDLDLREDIFTIEQEMLMKGLWRGHHIVEVPTREAARAQGDSRIHLKKVAHRYVWCLLKGLLRSGRPRGKPAARGGGTVEWR